MLIQTILNHVEKYKSFVYGEARWKGSGKERDLEVEVRPRKNGRPRCSGCHKLRPGYDRLAVRRFEFPPLWAIHIFLLYALRRVNCPGCGIVVEEVPWCQGKHQQTTSYRWFLAQWAKRLSWQQVAQCFGASWDTVYAAVLMAVHWGLANRSLTGLEAIGVDEIQWLRGHKYLTLVYDLTRQSRNQSGAPPRTPAGAAPLHPCWHALRANTS